MPVLKHDQLAGVRLKHDRGSHPHGYPVTLIRDLLDTIDYMRAAKKRWQRVAEDRGRRLEKIYELSNPARGFEDA